jgi:hypothetical protein
MTSLRKWRFPILIGSGLIAAGILFYYSNTHVSSDKTQGAIGQRDVYRDGQVNSADVATPGSAPVATTAILESSEFKSLAKDQAFQELLRSSEFTELSRSQAFVGLLADKSFQEMMQNLKFAAILRFQAFQDALARSAKQDMNRQELHAFLKENSQFAAFANSQAFSNLFRNNMFREMASNQLFLGLVASNALRQNMAQPAFLALASQSSFQQALLQGSAAQMMAGLRRE